ncbi:hypothetical protein F0919_11040 [Taibaiella lutea]|uniref:Secretory protein n=1 Tax=Taibaiella lutea TaxID=2608001 RepID=A0A5M6CJA2_9BACT|nr:hypothetical protein [Taibaiella lutea]KAA5535117.1 hypothetical protein F0919_11040 [Taibaiella lutea]
MSIQFYIDEVPDIVIYLETRLNFCNVNYKCLTYTPIIVGKECVPYTNYNEQGIVTIYLSKDICIGDRVGDAVLQISHEIIHCIRPPKAYAGTNVLEEGLATWFAYEYTRHRFAGTNYGNNLKPSDKSNYLCAFDLYEKLIEVFPDCVKHILHDNPNLVIKDIKSKHFEEVFNKHRGGFKDEYKAMINALILDFIY